jgi:hypothetical protein
MPLTAFQKEVAHILAAHRNPESHVAGGAVINRAETSLRFSEDIDIFHDIAESVAASAETDAKVLRAAGCTVEWALRQEGFFRAVVSRGEDGVRLDWANDSAFRFFPVQPDDLFGYSLHAADLAVNKVLALAGRTEIRDFLDLLFFDKTYLRLGALIWAGCGKDPGFTPPLLLDLTNRHSRFQEGDLKGVNLAQSIDFRELKNQWLHTRQQAEDLVERLPETELGCLYLDETDKPVTPDPNHVDFPKLKRHYGSVRGAWPKFS